MSDIHSKAPKGATHYFKNEFIVSYFFIPMRLNCGLFGISTLSTGVQKYSWIALKI